MPSLVLKSVSFFALKEIGDKMAQSHWQTKIGMISCAKLSRRSA